MIIKNMGLFWRPESIFWGRQKVRGRLLGFAKIAGNKLTNLDAEDIIENEQNEVVHDVDRNKYQKMEKILVDFRDQIGIYALYQDFRIVYVGQAGGKKNTSIFSRVKAHKGDHLAGRWNMFSWFGLKGVDISTTKEIDGFKIYNLLKFEDETHGCDNIINHLEGILIEVLENTENRQGASFNGTVKFQQQRDSTLPPTINEMISQLYNVAVPKNVTK